MRWLTLNSLCVIFIIRIETGTVVVFTFPHTNHLHTNGRNLFWRNIGDISGAIFQILGRILKVIQRLVENQIYVFNCRSAEVLFP